MGSIFLFLCNAKGYVVVIIVFFYLLLFFFSCLILERLPKVFKVFHSVFLVEMCDSRPGVLHWTHGRIVTYLEGLRAIKSYNGFVTWSWKVT